MFRSLFKRRQEVKAAEPAPVSVWTNQKPQYSAYIIGDWTYGNPLVKDWNQGTKLIVGKYCSIADGSAFLLGGEHKTNWITTFPFFELLNVPDEQHKIGATKRNVVLGNDVWVGMGAMILSGITIGSGAVVAAGSVVTKSVKPYSIVGGNPAKHIRFRIPEQHIASMLKIAWWDWPHERVLKEAPQLLSDDVEEFIKAFHQD